MQRAIISEEEWRRLPLTQNYKHPTVVRLIKRFPKIDPELLASLKLDNSNQATNANIKDIESKASALSAFGRDIILIYFLK